MPYGIGCHLFVILAAKMRLDVTYCLIDAACLDRSLLACLEKARTEFLPIKALPFSVLLHDPNIIKRDMLIRREAFLTFQAFAAAPDDSAIFYVTLVEHFSV